MPIIFLKNLVVLPTLTFIGETLPTAFIGTPYSQNIAGQASGGIPPYTFTMLSTSGPWLITSGGVINGTATAGSGRDIDTGDLRMTN